MYRLIIHILRFKLDFNPAILDSFYMIPYASDIDTFASAIFLCFCNLTVDYFIVHKVLKI